MDNIAIKVENLTKIYPLYNKPVDRMKEALHPFRKKYHHDFHALKDVSFEIKKGETVGIIGRNGAGKSTLLKILTGVLTQTTGNIDTRGKITSLLELGTGFNPELSGRENVYFYGTIFGFSRKFIESKINAIIDFADIGEFIEQPMKTYSSGMYVRVAFAVNVMLEPEIMIIDEALSVGDMNFGAKCMTMLDKIQKEGCTILFVSHDVGTVKSLCSKGIYFEKGSIKALGKASDIAELYIKDMREAMNSDQRKFLRKPETFKTEENNEELEPPTPNSENLEFKTSEEFDKRVSHARYGTGEAKITYVELLNMNDEPISSVEFNQEVKIRIYSEFYASKFISVNFAIMDDKKIQITGSGFLNVNQELLMPDKGDKYILEYRLRLPLQSGNYSITARISSPIILNKKAEFLDSINDAVVFSLNNSDSKLTWWKVHLFPKFNIIKYNLKRTIHDNYS